MKATMRRTTRETPTRMRMRRRMLDVLEGQSALTSLRITSREASQTTRRMHVSKSQNLTATSG
eukprot:5339221-Pleurochrysis_carterae.AAC.1